MQELFLPHTLSAPWESKRKSPLAKANERIAELEAELEEVLDDLKLFMAMEKLGGKLAADDPEVALDAIDETFDLILGPTA